MNIYDVKIKKMNGEEKSMADYKGKVLLIVNTATGCGFTPQYDALQDLYEKYSKDGFEILDFPCNQFGNQASGSNEEIATFCTGRFGITFEQFAKIEVNGDNEAPIYTVLKEEKGGILGSKIKWNFTKFLLDRNGNVIKRIAPTVDPATLDDDIAKLIKE